MSINKKTFFCMLSYYKPYMGMFWADMFFACLSSAVALSIPLVVRYVTSTLIYKESSQILHETLLIAIMLFLMLLVDCYARFFIGNYGHVMGAKIEYNMRSEIFAHMQKLSFSFYDDAKVGQLMSRITTDLFDITELLHHGPENIILSVIKIVGALIILLGINPLLTLAAFLVLPFMIAFAYVLNKRMRSAFRKNRQKIAEINGQIEDNLSGIRVVKSFANEEIENKKFKIGNDGFLASKRENYHYMGSFQAGIGVCTTLIQVNVILIGSVLIAYQKLSISDLITFLLYITVFTEPIKTLVDFTEQFQNGYTGFERFREIMDIEPDIMDREGAKDIDDSKIEGNITFTNVSFTYGLEKEENGSKKATVSDGNRNENVTKKGSISYSNHKNDYPPNGHHARTVQVLNHINLDVKAGSYIALVGPSGAGKTTLCSLIPRFYEVTDGSISIDGIDIRDITLKSLRNHIGVVQQDVYLFAGTIYENISYGKPGATREEVIAAAKNANAHEFIMAFPDGYDTDIGQRGIKLSGGQKQRLSIARVFLKNPPILILDEATSALDNESERIVQDSLEKLACHRTTIVIAHRLTTIMNAENILVLTEDGIAESGTHEELLAKGGIYEKLYHGNHSTIN